MTQRPRPSRRSVLRAGADTTALGLIALALPSASAAASVADPASTTVLQGITVDPSGEILVADHDVTYRIGLFTADGRPYAQATTVTLRVRLDDGSADGAGSTPAGVLIDGEDTDEVMRATSTGGLAVSVAVPDARGYLVRITTDPASLNHPDGIELSLQVV